MMREAIDTCWRSMPSVSIIPKVIASVSGMDIAIRSAGRHSQKPTRATSTTRTIASYRLIMKRSTLSSTWSGWSEVRAMIRSSGNRGRRSPRARSTPAPNWAIYCPGRICTARVMARLRCQRPVASLNV